MRALLLHHLCQRCAERWQIRTLEHTCTIRKAPTSCPSTRHMEAALDNEAPSTRVLAGIVGTALLAHSGQVRDATKPRAPRHRARRRCRLWLRLGLWLGLRLRLGLGLRLRLWCGGRDRARVPQARVAVRCPTGADAPVPGPHLTPSRDAEFDALASLQAPAMGLASIEGHRSREDAVVGSCVVGAVRSTACPVNTSVNRLELRWTGRRLGLRLRLGLGLWLGLRLRCGGGTGGRASTAGRAFSRGRADTGIAEPELHGLLGPGLPTEVE
mmetsp:Transcript_44393/g.123439  ORF Transcript_44393/g.123439 Transcript_44393/m.123439 type:complete len:270 (-) Transcript_44393:1716-2525(-)